MLAVRNYDVDPICTKATSFWGRAPYQKDHEYWPGTCYRDVMTCCALVVILLMQLTAPLTWLWRRFAGSREPVNTAVAWSPSLASAEAVETSTQKRRFLGGRRRQWILAIAGIELLAVAGTTAAFLAPSTDGRSEIATFSGTAAGILAAQPNHPLRDSNWLRDFHDNIWCRSIGVSTVPPTVVNAPSSERES